jgi:hypothetical protein
MCLGAQFKWDESQTIFEQVLSHYDEQKGRNSADSLAALMQIAKYLYRYSHIQFFCGRDAAFSKLSTGADVPCWRYLFWKIATHVMF